MARKRVAKREIDHIVSKWKELLGLSEWDIRVKVGKLPEGTAAETNANHEYADALITVDPWQSYDAIEETIVHELVHLHLWGMGHVLTTLAKERKKAIEWGRVEEERAVTALTRALLRAMHSE